MPRVSLADIASIIRREVQIDSDTEYPELGIRSFGAGTFHKGPVLGALLGSKRIFRIEPGDLLFSNVFAWEGAVAVAKSQDAGRYGSHRFISCVVNPRIATPEFLRYFFLTPEGLQKLGEASPGGAGRNRTLGLEALRRIEVPVPELSKQRCLDRLLGKMNEILAIRSQITSDSAVLLRAVLRQLMDLGEGT